VSGLARSSDRSLASARTRTLLRKGGGLAVGAVVWELAAAVVGDPVVLPSVQETFHALIHYMGTPYPSNGVPLWHDAIISLLRILVGFVVGVVVGVLLGAAMASIRVLKEILDPIVQATRPLPPLAFIPVFIVWFGIGETSKVTLVTVGTIPIMIVATLAALEGVPERLLDTGRVLGAGRVYNVFHVRIRASVPGIVTGMRLSMGIAWTSIMAVEMIAATEGIGFVILQAGNYLVTPLIFAGIVLISIMALILDTLLLLLLWAVDPVSRAK
jgi:ABC-type nitrate/sulfonate/bicarbonate transport system permease component